MKHWPLLRFIASSLHCFIASLLHCCQHCINSCRIAIKQGKTLRHICKGKDNDVYNFARETTERTNFFGNYQWNSSLHRFCALIFFFVKALRQWWQIREAMKWWNINYGKKLKQWSDEAFNAGKEIEAMKHLMLHRIASSLHCFIASSLHCFIASVAQLCILNNSWICRRMSLS